jgi:hypothetical protein
MAGATQNEAQNGNLAVRAFGNQYAAILATAYGGIWNADQVIRPVRFQWDRYAIAEATLRRNPFIRSQLRI